ncbi:receptor-like protein kinase FERONIA [Durio zibethinus]|uniref:non-specific serine/threonine protein kinase n=1 Tax=Durio zibethinus TaxID=66656 RepID=A0A6P5Y5E3_DURZI|nr:receptor-like protein kinase FERONIA [Durio zibethinus]
MPKAYDCLSVILKHNVFLIMIFDFLLPKAFVSLRENLKQNEIPVRAVDIPGICTFPSFHTYFRHIKEHLSVFCGSCSIGNIVLNLNYELWPFGCSNAWHVTYGIGQERLGHAWTLILLTSLLQISFVSSDGLAYLPSESIFLDCGSSLEQSQSYKGRNWSSDIGSQFAASNSDSNSTLSNASKGTTVPGVPYMTARLFYSKFSYTFNVTPGPKFIRLHFYSDSYGGLNASESFLTVTAGRYTLLRNFSCYLTAKYLKVDYFFKEFIIHVENHTLELIFGPTSDASNAYGFVNGIEVVSMPLNLYIRGNDVYLPFVGFHPNVLSFDYNFALEMVYRANVGGQTISPDRDTRMFRTWNADEIYIFGAAFGQLDYDLTLPIQYSKMVPAYTAPEDVYRTARSMGQTNEINKNYNLSWFFPVDTGFKYLVRLHFCEIVPGMTLENQRVFFIFINNQTAENQADVMVWSKGHGIPVYRDYVVMIPLQTVGKQDLWLELHPNIQVKPEYYDAILNGVEIFKISNFDGNLAGLNPPIDESKFQPSAAPSKKSKKGLPKEIKYSISGAFPLFFFLVVFLVIKTKRIWKMKKTKDSSHCRSFSFNDIRKATDNFANSLVILDWGFGKVYKGSINGIATSAAILRMAKATSEECFFEEIKMLSQIRHHNILPLLGFCQEGLEMILVYEYMDNGTLSDHLYEHLEERKKPLSWNQRLEICVGIARGLHYLHTGKKRPIIHCDINSSNILLDKNLTAKISNFGSTMTSQISNGSSMDGSIGSLNLDWDKRFTTKTDVYSFGLVLLEVLTGRPAPANLKAENDENVSSGDDLECLIPPASHCLEKGDTDQLVDHHLKGEISPESLRNFVKITKQCLAKKGVRRPSMSEVLYDLEQLLMRGDSDSNASTKCLYPQSSSDLMLGVEFSDIMMSTSGR